MWTFHPTVRIKRVVAVCFAIALAMLVLYTTGGYVAAYRETKNAHVFPTAVVAHGWNNPAGALAQELGASAPYESFTTTNAAYISIVGNTPVRAAQQETPTEVASSTESSIPVEATSTPSTDVPPTAEPEIPVEQESAPETPVPPVESPIEEPLEQTPSEPAVESVESTPAQTPEEPVVQPSEDVPAPSPVEPSAPPVESVPVETSVSDAFKKFVSILIPTVYATSTDDVVTTDEHIDLGASDTPVVSEDVPTCFLQQKECHTITLTGFTVSGEITETTFQKASLNFSFAANIGETELVDDKLEVRYYHAGKWREVGEIYLNKQFSNGANGGYFTATLDNVESWDDFSDLKVVIEYDRNNDAAIDLYLDAVWIDSQYRELLSEVVSGDESGLEVPENVIMELNEGGAVGELVLADGSHISFPYTDGSDGAIIFRTDKATYSHTGETVYASLTNTSALSDSVRLYAAFPRGFGSVSEIAELKKNIPTTTETPTYQDVTYLCDVGWVQSLGVASTSPESSGAYTCEATGETRTCTSLNSDTTNCSVSQVQVGSESSVTYESGWITVPFSDAQDARERIAEYVPAHYRPVAQTEPIIDILPGQTVYLRLKLESTDKDTLQFALVAEGATLTGDLDSELLKEETVIKGEESNQKSARKKGNSRLFGKAEFDGDELPQFKFQFKSKRNFVSRGINALLGRGNDFAVQDARFMRDDGTEEVVPVSISYGQNGQWSLEVKTHPRSFRPGKYTAHITLREGADEFVENVEFYWGILAINTSQTIYKPGDVVSIAMAALDDAGDTVCDANLELSVSSPSGDSATVPVEVSGLCGDNNVVDVADYLATYTAGAPGTYTLSLTERDAAGLIVHRIFDAFEVRESSPFTIRRSGMTRIYPVADYTMSMELTSENDFEGEFIESIPADFRIVQTDASETRMYGGAKNLVWPVSLKAGETMRVSYTYDAPDISPYMYLLGPAKVQGTDDGIPFTETRQWKLASDATGNMLVYWDQTWIPTGWTCVSCLPSDSFYQRFIIGSSTAGVNGGSATSVHTGSGAVAATANIQGVDNNTVATPSTGHTHTFTPSIATANNLPQYKNIVVIQYNSTGEPPSIPAGAIAMFDDTVPAGWSTYTAYDGNYIRGESTSTVGTTGGSPTHAHGVSGTTGASAGTINIRNPGTSVAVAATAHTHTVSTSTETSSNEPPFITAIFAKLDATSTPSNDMITMWTDAPATGWTTTSSSSEAMANKFVIASSSYGTTGGAFTHTHSDEVTTTSGPSATVNRDSVPPDVNAASASHVHSVTISNISAASNLPPYRTAVFGKRTGAAAPLSPVLYTPFDNEKTGTSTPEIEFMSSDPIASETLVYQVQWDDDSDIVSAPLGDHTSDDESGCSPACFENLTTPADTSPFTEAERIRFTIQTPLVSGTTYYMRVRAQKSSGSQWSSWSTTTSFTYVANIEPSQWYQTDDGQFDTNTLSGVETTGSGSAQLSLAAQTEAMIVYGEGVVQTPRYRIWSGSAWSAELSASNVGGTVQWVAIKGGTTRDEYVLGTQDASNDVNVQVFDGTTDAWGSVTEVTATVANTARRGFDVAYETLSGDALVVYCDGDADPSYNVWNGSSWSGATTINLTSTNNCEYIKLASDPLSDEIIVVSRDTGAGYEAQVWDGSAWGNARTLGSMIDIAHEGIGLEYEASGDQAIVTVSNGAASSFVWTSWNGAEWGINTTQALGDDFEWGSLRADDGSDTMALCYIDQDADIGVVQWDGNAWITFSERDVGGNSNTGRAVDCAFETTAGRDGYIMLPYSDTVAARYQYWNGTSWAAEGTISTIQDATTVETIRTGDGVILSVFNDDVNTQFDFSYWNGSSWATIETLETSPSVTVAPFLQPFAMTPKVYQSSSGTMTTNVIDFDDVPGRQAWGEVLFRTTEQNGTDVKVQIFYENAGVCDTLIPNGTLPGNGAGFDATSSPVNISALSTSTYNRICLQATFATSNQNVPTLDEWTVTWERQAYLTQTHFFWYANAASSLTPSDPWPSGADDLSEDVVIPSTYAPSPNDVLRLRMSVLAENVALSAGDLSLKLQYAEGESCSADLSWQDVGAIASTTAAWRGYNNAALSDGATLVSALIATTDDLQSYEEENDSVLNPNTVSTNDEGEWDWVLQHNALSNTSYCFRAVTSGGEVLNEYDTYPALITNSPPDAPIQEAPFNNEALASTTPWFDFAADDPEGDDITYQIQIDDDSAFGSVNIDRDSQTFLDEFSNLVTPSDKDPFTTAQSVRFIPTTALSNGTTYYWRVRGKDRTRSGEWSPWSTIQSVTIDTGVTISTWRQTTMFQFSENTHEDTEATSTNDVVLTPPLTTGTTTGALIDFDWKTTGNAWGSLSFNDTETSSDIKYHIEYYDDTTGEWSLVPDTDLTGNDAGYDTSPVSLLSVSPTIYNQIRIRANLTNSGLTPHLLDWQIAWGLAVEQPQITSLFDNEKTGTTTPTFSFTSGDPQSNDLVYEVSISTTQDFSASTTRRSSLHSGFVNTASSTDTSPFTQDNLIAFTLQAADALTDSTTYWWKVRAIDPSGGNVWSVWSELRSFTVDTTASVSTWFQTTNEQWLTNGLSSIETNSGSTEITTIIREAFTAYAEGTVQVPRFRTWNGTAWGTEQSGVSIGDTIRFVEAAAAPTRDEYIVATLGSTGVVDAQVIDGSTDTAGNATEIVAAVSDTTQRGFDVAYETSSGDALAVACNGTEATYKVWNGSSWSASNPITLAVSANCEWIQLAPDPTSDEIILVARDAATGATDYNALVWNGSSWGNSMTMGSKNTATNEGIAVEYEESGGQAIVVVSNGTAASFIWNAWNGSAWSGTNTVALGDDFENGILARDVGSDNMAFCYVDFDSDIGYVRWDGASWSATTEIEVTGNGTNGRPVSCEFETTAGRDGYIMIPYSDSTQAEYQFWNGSVLSAAATISSISDSTMIRTARTGDGNILMLAYDDANTEYDFSYWNGASWSTEDVLEVTSITSITPRTSPLDIVARRYPAFTSGTIESSPIVFSDGSGPKWGAISFNATTPGSSYIAFQLEYLTSTSSWALIPDVDFSGNSVGTTTTPIDISNINRITYSTVRMKAAFNCVSGDCPTLQDWTLTWAEGLGISGTAKQYDQTTNVTGGTVAVAVNGVIQSGKTGVISGGVWSIPNVTFFQDDIITVFVDGANDTAEAIAITKYDGLGDVTGMEIIERHVTLGSDDNPTLSNADLGQYDNSVSGDEDVFHEVDAGNDFSACVLGGCFDVELYIKSGTVFRPDSASSGNVAVYGVENNGTLTADGNTISLTGSWDNNAIFNADASTVVFTATSSTQSVDSTGASVFAFNNVTFGTSGTATWTLATALDVNGGLTVNFGTLAPGLQPITIAGNLTFGASGIFAKGSATTTFDGTATATWTDNTVAKQDLGTTTIDGTAKLVNLGAAAKATNITIGADDTLSVNNNYALEVTGNWTNNNLFVAQSGTVTFSATTTGKTIIPGSSSFYNIIFNGSGGNWAFTSAVTAGNNFTVTAGTVTLPSSTTTVTGSFIASTGAFQHNNGEVLFNSGSAGKTVTPGTSSFYDLTFNGAGAWSFGGANATSSRHVTITQGALTLPSGTLAVGGSFVKTGGSFAHNSGTLKLTGTSALLLQFSGSDANNLTFAGIGGSWSFNDASATTTNTVRFENGTVTLPVGTFAVGGSWENAGGIVTAGSGTVRFVATSSGKTVTPGSSSFANVIFDGASGGWTITQNATTTAALSISNSTAFTVSSGTTLAVGGTFTNSVGGAATTWTGSTLVLDSGTSYSINTKSVGDDTYGTLRVGPSTDVRVWNSSAATTTVDATGSLYSQDHAAVDGDLYIYGEYVRSSGTEYWTYANDFDGTALGGSSRQVNVRIASSSSLTFNGGLLQLLGSAIASTTIANQGNGAYAWAVSGGTVNAQYYSVRNTDQNGMNLSGTTAITSLADGDFELGTNGWTMMTVASTVIDANALLQIQRSRFATSTGVTSGASVTETGTPSSYWWFRNHYGSYAGESFDADPGGNPGFIRWDDSSLAITVSGTVYSDEGITAIGNPPCDGVTPTVKIVVNGSASYTGSCNAGSGAFSISGIAIAGDVVLTGYLDTNGGARAVTISRTPTTDISNFDLYEDALIVRHEDTSPITIAQIATYDGTADSDIPFTASTSSPPSTLTLIPDTELYIWTGKTFTPGGNVTLQSGGSGSARDGRLMLATSSAFIATGSESHGIGGGLSIQSGATFTAASSTFTFTATTTGKSIYATAPIALWNATFNGSGGGWSMNNGSNALTIQNTLSLAAGTLSGTGDMVVSQGSIDGSGVIAMTGGTIWVENSGTFGNSNEWQFANLTLGSGTGSGATVKTGTGTTTVTGVLSVNALQSLYAASSSWVLSGSGTPFVVNGTFESQIAPFTFAGTGATTIADESYASLVLSPGAPGTPLYTLQGGTLSASALSVGGTNPVAVDSDANDPSIAVGGNVSIGAGSSFTASNVGAFDIGGSWSNAGTFTASGATVNFNSTDTGETIDPGTSAFFNISFTSPTGGWTIAESATSTNDLSISDASEFTLAPDKTLAVGGIFTNDVGGSATTWATSTLSLYSGTSYSINTKSAGSDVYDTLLVGANTDVRMWHSSATAITVDPTGSLYSQDHAAVDGDLYIWGQYERSSGSDYWSYSTDFDGVSIASSTRQVDVRIATSSSVTISGGTLDITGSAAATTTIANQGTGRYAFAVNGGTLNAQYYQVRDTDTSGLNLTGASTITTLSDGDYELNVNGGSLITVAGSVIDANPLKIFLRNIFATSTGITSGFNVRATGSSVSSWKFNLHAGNFDGEAFNSDPAGDPGYIRWDDSASNITIAGNVYSDEGTTVSTVCDGTTQAIRLKVQGAGAFTSSCDASTGAYSIPNVAFNPGDTITVYLDTAGGPSAANVSVDPVSSITNMHLYENRVIVRHEDVNPISIVHMTQYDSDQDPDIPFNATDAATDTLVLQPNTKLIVFTDKTFVPGGNITLVSGGSGSAWDGTLEVFTGGELTAEGNQAHAIGGSLLIDSGATLTSASSTFTMTATTTGKTISLNGSTLYNVVFNGGGGNWAFSGGTMTALNDFTITSGTVTLPTATSTIGGSFQNVGGVFMHNNGVVLMNATASGKSVRTSGSSFYTLEFNGVGGSWSFIDTAATSSNNFVITNGTVAAPSSSLTVGGSFQNFDTFTSGVGTLTLVSNAADETVRMGSSALYNVVIDGVGGAWIFEDTNATVTRDFSILNGSTTLPTGVLTVGGSWASSGGTFAAGSGTVSLNATTTGKTINSGASSFNGLEFNSSAGGWTIAEHATSTGDVTIASATAFTLASGKTLAVGGAFTNGVGGAPTTWTGSILSLDSGTSYSINTKSAGSDVYDTLLVGANTDVRMWNSSATAITVDPTGSLYSQDHAAVDGDLYIWGQYERSSGSDYWSYATDFDGTSLGGSSRQVDVRIATSSSVTLSGGSLEILGSTATTTIANQGTGRYAFAVSGGTLNATHYQVRDLDPNGLNFSGTPTITALDYGDLQIGVDGGAMITLAGSVIDANASKQVSYVSFATTTGISSGYNVVRTGSPISAWTFLNHNGNYDGESYDSDGGDSCGNVRWSDSACLFVNQGHYRWRQDDGGVGAPDSEWYSASWSKRKRVAVSNPTGSVMTDQAVELVVEYDADMQGDFEDLRFTDASGTTSIPYWIESSNASASSTVWVKLSSIPANDSAVIYMYYGNSGVSDGGDGVSTFKTFDDFEDDSLSEYTNTSLFDTDTTFNHNYLFGLDAGTNAELRTTSGGMYRSGALSAPGDTIRFYQYMDAAAEDEPCTLFGVQSQTQNYAVCLDQYPTERVALVKDALSNDGSGTSLASTSVTFATGWYEVQVDWLSTNDINVTVYDDTGAVFATVTANDSSYSSGGIGFSFWYQHGGWDFYSVRPYAASVPTYVFGTEQVSGGASWYAAEDTALSGVAPGANVRVRFTVQNSGAPLSNENFRLQYAAKGASLNCESVAFGNYSDVPTTTGGCGGAAACMTTSSQFTDQTAVSDLLSRPASMSFVQGRIMEDPSNQTSATSVATNAATEVEYNFQITGNAVAPSYCFRTSSGGTSLDNYDHVAEIVLAHAPSITNWALNEGLDIALTEGATTTVSATGTVTDLNGWGDIATASSTIYRSTLGSSCSEDNNNCYPVGSCSLLNCSGNSCTISCSTQIQYLADPTDAGSTYSAEEWLASVRVEDVSGLSDTDTSFGVELLTLYGLTVTTPGIDFGLLNVGDNTGATTTLSTIVNTGNAPIDINLYGTDLEGPSGPTGAIGVGEQKVATSTFTYASCSVCQLLSGASTPIEVDISLPKPTSTSTPVTDDLFWGINVPINTAAETHTGTNTFIATSDN